MEQKLKQSHSQSPIMADLFEEDIEEQSCEKQGAKRKSSSLALVTKQFVEQIRKQKDMTICLNDAMRKMNLKKRRLYDIANVLEGIGYVRKDMRNHLKWIGGGEDPQKAVELHFLKDYFRELKETERQLNEEIQKSQQSLFSILKQNEGNQNFLNVSIEDCEQVRQHLNQIKSENRDQMSVIIFQVPKGTELWNQLDKETGLYTVKLSSEMGQISSYLIQPGESMRKCNPRDL